MCLEAPTGRGARLQQLLLPEPDYLYRGTGPIS